MLMSNSIDFSFLSIAFKLFPAYFLFLLFSVLVLFCKHSWSIESLPRGRRDPHP